MIARHYDCGRTLSRRYNETQWTPFMIGQLTDLWVNGENGVRLSASQIGARMGITGNAVLGKAHRLGLPSRPSPLASNSPTRSRQLGTAKRAPSNPIPRAPKVTLFPHIPYASPAVRLDPAPDLDEEREVYDLRKLRSERMPAPKPRLKECCWPIGEPRTPGFRFCDGPVKRGSYCVEHAAAAYAPAAKQNEAAA